MTRRAATLGSPRARAHRRQARRLRPIELRPSRPPRGPGPRSRLGSCSAVTAVCGLNRERLRPLSAETSAPRTSLVTFILYYEKSDSRPCATSRRRRGITHFHVKGWCGGLLGPIFCSINITYFFPPSCPHRESTRRGNKKQQNTFPLLSASACAGPAAGSRRACRTWYRLISP